MPLFETGQVTFGLNDVKIAVWNGDGTYGTAVDVPSVQQVSVMLQFSSAQLTGDDKITATASRAIGGSGSVRWGSISLAVLEVLLGGTATSSVASPNNVKNFRVAGGGAAQYFGLVGRALADDGQDTHVFIPQAKITGDLPIASMAYGEFTVPEAPFTMVADEDWGVLNIVTHETAAAVAIPPANIPQIA